MLDGQDETDVMYNLEVPNEKPAQIAGTHSCYLKLHIQSIRINIVIDIFKYSGSLSIF